MKNACIRLRKLDCIIGVNKDKKVGDEEIKAKEAELVSKGYRKVFDTINLIFNIKSLIGITTFNCKI